MTCVIVVFDKLLRKHVKIPYVNLSVFSGSSIQVPLKFH